MQITQKQRIEAYQRAQDFLTQTPLADPGYSEPKRMLDEVVERLAELLRSRQFDRSWSPFRKVAVAHVLAVRQS